MEGELVGEVPTSKSQGLIVLLLRPAGTRRGQRGPPVTTSNPQSAPVSPSIRRGSGMGQLGGEVPTSKSQGLTALLLRPAGTQRGQRGPPAIPSNPQ